MSDDEAARDELANPDAEPVLTPLEEGQVWVWHKNLRHWSRVNPDE